MAERHTDIGQPVFHSVRRAAGSIFNYVNADDYALRFWNINQRQKPDPTTSRFGYVGGRDLGARARFQETSDRYFEWRVRNNREALKPPSRSRCPTTAGTGEIDRRWTGDSHRGRRRFDRNERSDRGLGAARRCGLSHRPAACSSFVRCLRCLR